MPTYLISTLSQTQDVVLMLGFMRNGKISAEKLGNERGKISAVKIFHFPTALDEF